MPRTIELEDGSTIEVFTADEIEAQKTAALADAQKKWDEEKAEIEKGVNPNWKEVRDQLKQMKEKPPAQEVPPAPAPQPQMTADEIRKIARAELLEERKQSMLSKYDKDTRVTVEHYYNKLSQGEELNDEAMGRYMDEAAQLAVPAQDANNPVHRAAGVSGQPPRLPDGSTPQNYADTDTGKQMADVLFGEESFTKAK